MHQWEINTDVSTINCNQFFFHVILQTISIKIRCLHVRCLRCFTIFSLTLARKVGLKGRKEYHVWKKQVKHPFPKHMFSSWHPGHCRNCVQWELIWLLTAIWDSSRVTCSHLNYAKSRLWLKQLHCQSGFLGYVWAKGEVICNQSSTD